MNEKLPRFDFYPADWLCSARVRRMPIAARGLYIDMLAFQWRDGGLPDDRVAIAGMTATAIEDVSLVWDAVRSAFTVGSDGLLRNDRLERERASAIERLERASANGRAGNAKRWGSPPDRSAATTTRSHSPSPSPSPSPEKGPAALEPVAVAPAPLPKKPRAVPQTDHHQTIDGWCVAYQESQGEPYDVQSKDAAAVKGMLKKHTKDEILAQADKLLFCESPFHAEHRTLSWLAAKWNEVGQLARANSLRLEGSGSKVVREAARMEQSGTRPLALEFLDSNQKQITVRST